MFLVKTMISKNGIIEFLQDKMKYWQLTLKAFH